MNKNLRERRNKVIRLVCIPVCMRVCACVCPHMFLIIGFPVTYLCGYKVYLLKQKESKTKETSPCYHLIIHKRDNTDLGLQYW